MKAAVSDQVHAIIAEQLSSIQELLHSLVQEELKEELKTLNDQGKVPNTVCTDKFEKLKQQMNALGDQLNTAQHQLQSKEERIKTLEFNLDVL